MINTFRSCCAVVLFSFAAFAMAEQTATRTYPLPGHGSFQMTVPQSWQEEIQKPDNAPATITYKPASGPAFQIMVTPIAHPGTPKSSMADVKRRIESIIAKDIAPHAVEKNIAIKELRSPTVEGYYYSATDKAPAPDEYKLMTQAEFNAGELIVVVTVLSNDDSAAVLAQALAMMKSSKHVK